MDDQAVTHLQGANIPSVIDCVVGHAIEEGLVD